MARSTQWDVINDPAGSTRYVYRVLIFNSRLCCASPVAWPWRRSWLKPSGGPPPSSRRSPRRMPWGGIA